MGILSSWRLAKRWRSPLPRPDLFSHEATACPSTPKRAMVVAMNDDYPRLIRNLGNQLLTELVKELVKEALEQ